nr:sensor domain-containing diguanylate cyclase [Arsukibacterium sp.]
MFNTRQNLSHIKVAGVIGAIMLFAALLLHNRLNIVLPEVKPFLPIYATCIILLEGLTGYLLISQFLSNRRWYVGVIAGGYLFLIPLVAIQLMVFPGVFSDSGLLNAGSQSAVWIWVFWHAGFPAIMLLALLTERLAKNKRVPKASAPLWAFNFVALALLFGIGLALLATWYSQHLPALISQNSYQQLLHSPFAIMVWVLNIMALACMAWRCRLGGVMPVWLTLALFASLLDVTLTLFAGNRFSIGWYAARVSSTVSATVLLGVLLWEINTLYLNMRRSNEQLYQLTMLDSLTGVYNRRFLDKQLQLELQLAARKRTSLALMLLDVDYFKAFNDSHGHLMGDHCLNQIAQSIASVLQRPADFVARYGGEEFAIVLPDTSSDGAMQVAEKLRQQLAELAIVSGSKTLNITVSIGVAVSIDGHHSPDGLLSQADNALYQAKNNGRNRVILAPPAATDNIEQAKPY